MGNTVGSGVTGALVGLVSGTGAEDVVPIGDDVAKGAAVGRPGLVSVGTSVAIDIDIDREN